MFINEEKLTSEIMRLAGGRILLAVGAALVAGLFLGGFFF